MINLILFEWDECGGLHDTNCMDVRFGYIRTSSQLEIAIQITFLVEYSPEFYRPITVWRAKRPVRIDQIIGYVLGYVLADVHAR